MANTANYNWPLPSPSGVQMNEVAKIATSFSAIDTTIKAFETSFSNHKHKFADLEDKPTTLGGYGITDGMTAAEVAQAIKKAVDDLVNGSGSALDTLKELADALGNDPKFATTVGNALGVRVRIDAEQSFTLAEKAQGRSNIDAVGTVDKGKADGVASLDSTGKVPTSQLPALTTTTTVGAAIAASDKMTGVSDGDHFAGLSGNSPVVRKFTWGDIKTWLRDFFDARFVQMGAPTFSSYKMDITSSSFCYMFWRNAHVAFVKKTGGYNFYWRRNDTGAEGGPNEQTLMSLSDSGLLSTQQGFSADSGSASMAIQPDGNIRGTAFGNDQYLTTYIINKAETARANAVNQAGNNVVNLYKSYAFNLNDSVGCTVYGRYTAKGGNVAIGDRIAGSQLNVAKANGGGWGDGGAVFGGTWVSLTGENAGSSDRGCWKKVAD